MALAGSFLSGDQMHINAQELTIPNPNKLGDLRLRFDLKTLFAAETRVEEIAFITPLKGAELMSVFSAALRDLSTYLAQLHYHSATAAKKKRERRAVVVVDLIPAKLAERKLSNNDSSREAIIELDPEHSVLCDIENEVEAAFVFVREKFRSIESHLNAVKKAMDATAGLVGMANPLLVQPAPAAPVPTTTTINGLKIGKSQI